MIGRAWFSTVFLYFFLSASAQYFPDNASSGLNYHELLFELPDNRQSDQLEAVWNARFPVGLPRSTYQSFASMRQAADWYVQSLEGLDTAFLQEHWAEAMYLSGFNPSARFRYDRKGLWQLPFHVGRRFGLRIDSSIDERLDVVKSTAAARRYYEELEGQFKGDASLAFALGPAAYVKRDSAERMEIRRIFQALEEIQSRVVPADVMAKSTWPEQSFREDVRVKLVCKAAKADEKLFLSMNPTLIGTRIPAGVAVRLPVQVDAEAMIAQTKASDQQWQVDLDSARVAVKKKIATPDGRRITYKVRSGDVLGRIASRFGVKVSDLRRWNRLSGDMIRIGQKLTIYYPENKALPKDPEPKAKPQVARKTTPLPAGGYTVYVVQQGDTLWQISRKYEGVSPEDIMSWNGIDEHIDVGQQLKIKKR